MAYPTLIAEIALTTDPLATPAWTNVSTYLRGQQPSFNSQRKRSGQLGRFNAGVATFEFDDRDRRFDPDNPARPAPYDLLNIGKRIRMRATHLATTYPIFDGFITGITHRYPSHGDAVAVISAVDGMRWPSIAELRHPYAKEILADNPTAYYRLNETSGTEAADSSPNGRTGTFVRLTGSAPPVTDPILGQPDPITDSLDGAASFQGYSVLRIPFQAMPSGTQDFTFEGWFKRPDGFAGRAILMRTKRGQLTGANTGLDAAILQMETDGSLTFMIGDVFPNSIFTASIYEDDKWHFFQATRTGTTLRIYVDGAQVATGTHANYGYSIPIDRPGLAGQDNDEGNIGVSFQSISLDELAVYNYALSAARIADHYAARTAWKGELSGTRIGKVLDVVGIPAADRDIDPGNTSLQSASDIDNMRAIEHIQRVEETEEGLYFISRDGKHTFIERHALYKSPYSTSQATFGDIDGELPYEALEPVRDERDIYNEASVTPRDGQTQTAKDAAGITAHGRRSLIRSAQLMESVQEAVDKSNYLVFSYKDPRTRVDKIDLSAASGDAVITQMLNRELMDRITIRRRPPGGGAVVEIPAHIVGITHRIEGKPQRWVTTFDVFPAALATYWMLGISGSSELGTTTRLGY